MTRSFCSATLLGAIVLGLLASCAAPTQTQTQSTPAAPSTPAPSPDGFSTDTVRGKLNQAQQNEAQHQQELNQAGK